MPSQVPAPAKAPRSAETFYWSIVVFGFLYLGAILAYLAWLLLSGAVRDQFPNLNAQRASIAILMVGIGTTIQGVVLWAGHVTRIRLIGRGAADAIWAVMIASFLATSATVYKGILVSFPHVVIDRFVLLDESEVEEDEHQRLWLKDLKLRTSYDYNIQNQLSDSKDVTMAFALVVSDFERESTGSYDLRGGVSLLSTMDDLQDAGELPTTTKDADFRQRIHYSEADAT
jgi:hypothetical protein